MKILYSNQPFQYEQNSIFLAGPTPRKKEIKSWRPDALEILEKLNYNGCVYVPEWADGSPQIDYMAQVNWEDQGLTSAKIIAFWVPRLLPDMPAFTTNVEFGRFADDERARYGRPDGTVATRYLDWYYDRMTVHYNYKRGKPHVTLRSLMEVAARDAEVDGS